MTCNANSPLPVLDSTRLVGRPVFYSMAIIVLAFGVLNALSSGGFSTLGPAHAKGSEIGVHGWALILSSGAIGLVVFGAVLPAIALEFSCLQYGPIEIAGTIVRHTYAGPPDYESVTKGDTTEAVELVKGTGFSWVFSCVMRRFTASFTVRRRSSNRRHRADAADVRPM